VIFTPSSLVVRDRDLLGGTARFRGTRLPIEALFDDLEGGGTFRDFLQGFRVVACEAVLAALDDADMSSGSASEA
jgi:uncharacterized protein (DUF433 family)